jgi:hypothetical protein
VAPPPVKRANLTQVLPTVTVTVRATDRPIDLSDLCPGGEPKDDDDEMATTSSESKFEIINLDMSTAAQDNGEIEVKIAYFLKLSIFSRPCTQSTTTTIICK